MHPADAAELGLADGQRVEVESRRGKGWTVLRVDDGTPTGTVFQPMHWADEWARGASPNEATTDATDPVSKQPALKMCAVVVRPSGSAPGAADRAATPA